MLIETLLCARLWAEDLCAETRDSCAFKERDWKEGTSLVAQWLRIHLPMQGTRVRALVREDPTHCGTTKPVRHNY